LAPEFQNIRFATGFHLHQNYRDTVLFGFDQWLGVRCTSYHHYGINKQFQNYIVQKVTCRS